MNEICLSTEHVLEPPCDMFHKCIKLNMIVNVCTCICTHIITKEKTQKEGGAEGKQRKGNTNEGVLSGMTRAIYQSRKQKRGQPCATMPHVTRHASMF